MKFFTILLFLLSCFSVLPASAATWYVSPRGSDNGPGTERKPFLTLDKAVTAARETKAPGSRIVLRGGAYYDTDVTLTPEHSGLTIEAAPGEKPVLYGGVPIRNWEKDGDRFYSAPLPPRPEGTQPWEVRLLQVDDRMMSRSRLPSEGTLTHLSVFDVPWMSSTAGGWKRKPTDEELTTLKYRPGDIPAGMEVKNAEVTVVHMWDESVVGVAANDVEKATLTLSPASQHPAGAFGVKKYIVWNIREGLTAPGQWYHDRARGRIVYWPLPGRDPNKSRIVVPTTYSVLRIRGSAGAPVTDITVRGIDFAVTTVPLVTAGFAAGRFDGAISLNYTRNCRFDSISVRRVAGHAINTMTDCVGTRVENSEISDCGAGGLYVGGSDAVIRSNHVHDIGLSYPSAIGIFRGGKNNVVSHNEVHGCSYSAINYGGIGNIVEDNLIYDCMKVLHDGAAIYMFAAKDCILRRNLARDIIDTGGYGASSYYLDERSEGCIVEDNLSLRVARPSHNHMALRNTIRNNVFIVEGDARMTFPRSSEFTMNGNVVYATGKITIENPEAVTTWKSNVLFSGAGVVEKSKARPDEKYDFGDTVLTDPLFVDLKKGDYRYRPGSPASALGLKPVDVSRAGRLKSGNTSNR